MMTMNRSRRASVNPNWRAEWERIPGRAAYLWIYDEWLESDPRPGAIVVECGVALGKSVSYLANRCLEMGRDDIAIYAVDPWGGSDRNGEQQREADEVGGDFTLYCKYMRDFAPEAFEMVRPLRTGSFDASLLFDNNSCDVVTLDGPHDFQFVREEIGLWLPKVRGGGFLGGDDYEPEYQGVIDAVHEHFGKEHEVRHDQQWGTWRIRK